MNIKVVKITAIVIAIAFVLSLLGPLAYSYVFSAPAEGESGLPAEEKTVEELQEELKAAEERLAAIEQLEREAYTQSEERFRVMCERGRLSYLDIIFSSNSFADFTDRIVIAKELLEYDKNVMKSIDNIRNESVKVKGEIEALIRAIEVNELEVEKANA